MLSSLVLSSGTRLGAYEISAQIGAGGMGEVYRAVDSRLKRSVAIKVLPASVAGDPDRLARFQREAEVLAALNHPNIGAIYGLEKTPDLTALVMELVEGEDLSAHVARGPIAVADALPIAKEIAEALEYAHEHGIIHRDLKPANIKVRADGTVKVLDFGLAKALDPAITSGVDLANSPTLTARATHMGVILGTAAYMAPEQARGREVDRRADIWAFGAVLYEILTGRRAFEGDDVSSTVAAVLKDEVKWARLPADVPAPLQRLLRRCLERDPKRRLQAIGEARILLEDLMSGREPGGPAVTAAAGRPPRSQVWPVMAAASTLVALALLWPAVMYLNQPAEPAPVTRVEIFTPPTDDPLSFAISPDGRKLVFRAKSDSGPRLWVRALDQTEASPLAGTEGGAYPFWSPDATQIGFFADGKLKRVDIAGGGAQTLADAPSTRGGTWGNDVILFVPLLDGPLRKVSPGGGPVTAATRITPGQSSHRWPQFLPDGRQFLFLSALGLPDTRGLYLGSLDGEARRILPRALQAGQFVAPDQILQVTQGTLTAQPLDLKSGTVGEAVTLAQAVGSDSGVFASSVSVSQTGVLAYRGGNAIRRQLMWMTREGRSEPALPVDEAGYANPEFSPDGHFLASTRAAQGNIDIWTTDLVRRRLTRLTFDPNIDGNPVWSSDGRRIIFQSTRLGSSDLFEKPSDGSADERVLLKSASGKMPTDVSSDGKFLLFTEHDPASGSDLWVLPLTGDAKPTAVVRTPSDEAAGQFSPDVRWIAYQSNESGRTEVYVRAFPDGGTWQISTTGGYWPRWRRDGKELYFISPDGQLMAAPIATSANSRTFESGTAAALFSVRLASGGNIFATGYLARAQYAVAPDDRFLLNVPVDDVAVPINLIFNWERLLKKR